MTLMKAVQVSEPGKEFELVQREIPEPGEGQVRVRVLACGVCHGDAIVKEGKGFINIEYPRIPGHEVIGTIDKLGTNVSEYELGQRVGVGWPAGITYDGGYAEYMVTSAKECVLIPEELNEMDGAPLLCAGTTTFDALRHSGAGPGDVVAIQGIGGLGHLAIQYANRMGFKTVAISRSSDKKELAHKLGSQVFIDSEDQNVVQELQKLGGAKVILITAPNNKAVSELINGLGFDGKMVIVAGVDGPIQVFGGQLLHGRRSIQGWVAASPNAKQDTVDFSMLTDVRPVIETFSLEQISEAYDKMMNTQVRFRAVLTMGETPNK